MNDQVYAFDEFRLDPGQRTLSRAGTRIPLTPKVFDVLLVLIERAGEVVTREELIAAVWPDSYVEESNLTQTIFMLRKAIAPGEGDRYVVTVPGRGYRFAGKVTRGAPEPAVSGTTRGSLRWYAAAAVVLVLVASLIAASRKGRGTGERKMLAVLPFQNLTGDPAQEYFSDGLTEEMITQIGKLDSKELGVIARSSVMHFKNASVPLAKIRDELKVAYVLEGSVRRDTEKVRISAKLINAADQSALWTREYDRPLMQLLALERDIAHDIAEEIQLTLEEDRGAVEAGMTPRAFEAYDAYLKGRYHWSKRTTDGFEQAIRYFEASIEADPAQARAYAGLADCYILMPGYKVAPPAEFMTKARAAARKALAIDDQLAEAHTSLALILVNYDWDWEGAERAYRRAIELNANYATAHHWYAEFLMWMGRFDEALEASERARRLDPLSLIIAADNGVILLYARRYDLAEAKLESVLELEPNFPRAHMIRNVYAEQGRFDEALRDIAEATPNSTPWDLAYMLGRSGRREEARRAMDALESWNARQPVDPVAMARAHLACGDHEKAFTWLEKGFIDRSGMVTTLKVDAAWDPIRGDPRFVALLEKVGMVGPPS